MQIETSTAKRWLTAIWYTGAGGLGAIMLGQTIFGHYGERSADAWGWLLSAFMPTLSLITGVLAADALRRVPPRPVDGFVFALTAILSAVYLLVVAATILFSPLAGVGPLKLMNVSNLYLGPFQGLIAALTGVFFAQSRPADGTARSEPPAPSGFDVIPRATRAAPDAPTGGGHGATSS